jgi:hypothetical protein
VLTNSLNVKIKTVYSALKTKINAFPAKTTFNSLTMTVFVLKKHTLSLKISVVSVTISALRDAIQILIASAKTLIVLNAIQILKFVKFAKINFSYSELTVSKNALNPSSQSKTKTIKTL